MNVAERAAARSNAVASAVADIRRLADPDPSDAEPSDAEPSERGGSLDHARLERVKARLLELVAQRELFDPTDFPGPEGNHVRGSCLYRLSQDDDDRYALYVNSCPNVTNTPPHNHTTWAVVVGFDGNELNRFYERTEDGGVVETSQHMVERGAGIALLPDELHSIHIDGGGIFFHMYGMALERLERREYYLAESNTWKRFAAHPDIREARSQGSTTTAAS